MSRYELEPRSYTPLVARVTVGWDRPPQTFFAQVAMKPDREGGDEKITLWEGTSLRELPTAEAVLALVSPYAIVPDDLQARLEQNRVQSMSRTDGPLQLGMKQIIFQRPSND